MRPSRPGARSGLQARSQGRTLLWQQDRRRSPAAAAAETSEVWVREIEAEQLEIVLDDKDSRSGRRFLTDTGRRFRSWCDQPHNWLIDIHGDGRNFEKASGTGPSGKALSHPVY